MNKAKILAVMRKKKAQIDLIRGLAQDLAEWGLMVEPRHVTNTLLRIEKYHEDLGLPAPQFFRGDQ